MFTQDDFKDPDIIERLRAISMVRINKNIMTAFASLSLKEKRLANIEVNKYIKESLGGADWKETLLAEFAEICREELWETPKFDFSKVYVAPSEQGDEV